MSLSFLPSYLRNWIEVERNSLESDNGIEKSLCDLQETVDEKDDWVVVSYRKGTVDEVEEDNLNDLLQQYVVIGTNTSQDNAENKVKKSESSDNKEISTELLDNTAKDSGTRKSAKRRPHGPSKVKSTAMLKAHRYCPYVSVPHQLPCKIAIEKPNVPLVLKLNIAEGLFSSNQPAFNSPLKPQERQVENRIVPYYGKKHQGILPSEVLQVFRRLPEKTSTVIVPCDFPQLNYLRACALDDSVCVKYTNPSARTFHVVNTSDFDFFTSKKMTGHSMSLVRIHLVNNSPMLSLKHSCKDYQFPKTAYEDVVLQDYKEPPSKIFSINTSESLYSRFYSTKNKFENLLRSIIVLHILLKKKLESWKTMCNISKISIPSSTPTSTIAPYCNTKQPFSTIPEKSPRCQAHAVNVTTKQLRRQNRCAMRNHTTTSNRQRGMKCGRFQNNVGHRESWH